MKQSTESNKEEVNQEIKNNHWECVSCKTQYRDNHNVGITNSVENKTQCIKCYNAGVEVELV